MESLKGFLSQKLKLEVRAQKDGCGAQQMEVAQIQLDKRRKGEASEKRALA
jgi:hypothetical protein